MSVRSLEYLVQEALTGIRRNGVMAFASISTTALSLSVLWAFILSALGANHFAASQVSRFQIAVFMQDEATLDQTDHAVDKIRKMTGVEEAVLRDRNAEWTTFKQRNPDIESAGLPRNPLPYMVDVKMSKPELLTSVATKIRGMDGVEMVREGRERFSRVMALVRVVKVVSIVGVIVLLFTTAFIISNAIRLTLYARRQEIRIMQLVGATNQFIRIPLVMEGVVFGIAGAMAAFIILRIGSGYVAQSAGKITRLTGQLTSGIAPAELMMEMVVLGAVVGALGSLLSIRRFLHD